MEPSEMMERIKKMGDFQKVQFVIHYGSTCRGTNSEGSDIDICVGYDGVEEEASRFRFDLMSAFFDDRYDVQIFQLLPIYIRKDILKGDVLYCRDRSELYDIAYSVIKEFDDFKHRYYDYIGKEAIA